MKIEITDCTCSFNAYPHLIGKILDVIIDLSCIDRYGIFYDKMVYYIDISDVRVVEENEEVFEGFSLFTKDFKNE